jgi:hypothetical protein
VYRHAIADRRRKYVFATPGESVRDIAARERPDDPDGAATLMAWNLHLSLRRQPVAVDGPLLGSDIVYVEPPLP